MTTKVDGTNPSTVSYTPEQIAQWGRMVIYQASVSLYRQHRRWTRDELGSMQDIRASASTKNLRIPWDSYNDVEWHLLLDTVLSNEAACVIEALYFRDQSQRQAAHACGMSQSTVHRIHRRALATLRRALS